MTLEGNLSDMSLVDLLHVFASSQKTGRLLLRQESQRAVLWFDAGQLINAAILVGPQNHPSILGEEAALRLFEWSDAFFTFVAPGPNDHPRVGIQRPIDWLISEGLQRAALHAPPQLSPTTRLALRAQLEQPGSSVSLSVDEWRMLSQIIGEVTITEVAGCTGYSISLTMQIVGRLLAMGVVRVIAEPPPAPVALPAPARRAAAPAASPGFLGVVRAIRERLGRITAHEAGAWQATKS